MQRFDGLEGARGWLAWTVVVTHILQLTQITNEYLILLPLRDLGDTAVQVFIILSGFVICHLILEKREPYRAYLIRRFMRIYPVYFVCLALGIVSTFWFFEVLTASPWGTSLAAGPHMHAQIASMKDGGLYAHLLAHVTLLHGAIPTNILYESQFFFLSPAWSLSLEWQFYLVAPLVMAMIARPGSRLLLVAIAIAAQVAYDQRMFGEFQLPSFLPGAVTLFATGIVSRLATPYLFGKVPFPGAALLLFGGLLLVADVTQIHYVLWAVVIASVWAGGPEGKPAGLGRLLDGKVALWFGARSYSTYLVHVPIIQGLICLCAVIGFDYALTVAFTAILTPPAVLLASDLLHRLVEKPGIALGRRLAR